MGRQTRGGSRVFWVLGDTLKVLHQSTQPGRHKGGSNDSASGNDGTAGSNNILVLMSHYNKKLRELQCA